MNSATVTLPKKLVACLASLAMAFALVGFIPVDAFAGTYTGKFA